MMNTTPPWPHSPSPGEDDAPTPARLRERALRLGWSVILVGLAAAAVLAAPLQARPLAATAGTMATEPLTLTDHESSGVPTAAE
jgi:hypothetical protein